MNRWDLLVIIGLWGLIYAFFRGSIADYFVCDDFSMIAWNNQGPFLSNVGGMFTSLRGEWYRPLFELSMYVNWLLFRLRPQGYHLTNLLLHALATILVYDLARQLTGRRRAGVLAGALFAIFGYHAESVAWISGRTSIMGALFFALAVTLYLRCKRPQGRRSLWHGGSLAAFGLALLSKETTVVLPLVLLAYELCDPPPRWRELLPRLSPFFALAGLYLPLRFLAGGGHELLPSPRLWAMHYGYYVASPLVMIPGDYLASNAALAWRQLPALPFLTAALSSASMSLLASLGGRRLLREPGVRFGLLWLLVTPLPVIPVAAERLTYLPSMGFALAVGAAVRLAYGERGRLGRAVIAACVAALFLANAVTLSWRGYWWGQAAQLTQQVIADVQRLHPRLSPGSTLVFVNLPENVHHALALRNVMPYALWLLYDDRSVVAYTRLDVEGKLTTPAEIHQFVAQTTQGKESMVLLYQDGHLSEVTGECQ